MRARLSPDWLTAMPPVLGSVEVRKDEASSHVWYSGHVTEVKESAVKVAFEGDVWESAEYPLSHVRKTSKLSSNDLDKFEPRIGDEVELHVPANEHAPSSWRASVIQKVENVSNESLYFVVPLLHSSAAASGDRGHPAIVEKEMIRPKSTNDCLRRDGLGHEIYKLPAGLESWRLTSDAVGCFSHIEDQSGLVLIQILTNSLKLFGEAKAIRRAKMLLGIHVPKQAQIQKFQETREKRLSALEKKRNRIEGVGYKHSVEIQVDPSFIPRIIGKGGESVRALQDKHGVAIWIMPEDGSDERTIRIFGNSYESIEKTRAEVEFIEDSIPVEADAYRWILGRNGKTIQGFRDSCGLVYATLDRESRQLRLCGTRSSVQDAIAMFETHLMYYPVFAQMDEEMKSIVSQLEEYGDTTSGWEWGWYRDDDDDYTSMAGKGGAGGKDDWGSKGSKGTTGGGRGGKGSSSGTKATKTGGGKTGGWADWEEPHVGSRSGRSRSAKEEAMHDEWWERGEGEWWDWGESETWAGLDWHESTEVRPPKGSRGGGSDARGRNAVEEQHSVNEQHHTATPAKDGGIAKTGGKQWQRKNGRDNAAGEKELEGAEKTAQQGHAAASDRGRGNSNKGSGGRGGRAATAAAAAVTSDKQEAAPNQQVASDARPQRQAPPPGGRRMGKKGVRS